MESPRGLFCSNYGSKRGNFRVCLRAWCSKCYVPSKHLTFHVADATTDAGAVWKRKKDENRYNHARDGDMWTVPFQCEYCWIVNLKGREASELLPSDVMLMGYIRRMNLDMMWSREKATVTSTLNQLKKGAKMSEALGLEPLNLQRGPWPVEDDVGCQVALEILRASQEPGKHVKTYQQFETIRKLRSGFSNAFESGPCGSTKANIVFRANKGVTYSLRSAPTESLFFCQFMDGCLKRMGRVVVPDLAIGNRQMHYLMELLEDRVKDESLERSERRKCVMTGAYFMLCYGCSLRGHEGLFLEASSVCNMINTGKDGWIEKGKGGGTVEGHVCLPLLGMFKGEKGEQKHVMVMVNESKSGLNFRLWIERLVLVLRAEGKDKEVGPAFSNEKGDMITSGQMNDHFQELCLQAHEDRNDLFPTLTGPTGAHCYGVSRSFRRGANTRATEEGVKKEDRDLINRWSSYENKRGQKPNFGMSQHYLEIRLVLKRLLVYSKSL